MTTEIPSTIEQLTQNMVLYAPKLIFAILVLIIGFKLQRIIDNHLTKFFEKQEYDESIEKFIQSLLLTSYKIGVVLLSISIAGIETTSIVTAIGAAGFAVGLAIQGSMSNFASGILILTLKLIKTGEYIKINEYEGTVDKIEIFSTTLHTVDNKTITIPNSELTTNVLTNYSRQKFRRVDLRIGVSYDSNIERVKKVLLKIIRDQKNMVIENDKRNIFVRVDELADSAIMFSIRVWCKTEDYFSLKHNLLESIKDGLDKENIEIPYPTIAIEKK